MNSWLLENLAAVCTALLVIACTGALLLFGRKSAPAETVTAPVGNYPQQAGKQLFSRKEVSRHQTSDDCWIVLESREHGGQARVYNVTEYVEEHPGGQAILNNAGGNSTKGFYGPQHPARVFDMIEDFYIGDLAL
ncbi:hypothetical protein WJX74_009161 [Apatococcus lobatus]|uniref:Cytochrome b5 heme-binding domain-containing protein n=1 Tax=Apatococcus lobatus TaxID=904363 RepID=A0AAW1QHN3_9CHLO